MVWIPALGEKLYPITIKFSRYEYWSGLLFPIPGDLADPGIEHTTPVSLALAGRFFIWIKYLVLGKGEGMSDDVVRCALYVVT